MTVAANNPINEYVGDDSTNTFPFTFPVFNSSQILVSVASEGGELDTLDLGTDYLVSGLNAAGDPASSGTITLVNSGQAWLNSGNLATGWVITIQSNFAYAQTTSLRNQGDFYRSALENALDNLEYQIQQMQMLIGIGNVTLVDIVTGYTYRLIMVNGILSQQRIS